MANKTFNLTFQSWANVENLKKALEFRHMQYQFNVVKTGTDLTPTTEYYHFVIEYTYLSDVFWLGSKFERIGQ